MSLRHSSNFWHNAWLKLFHIHILTWQHGSCFHLAMATNPPPILINSLHPNYAIQSTLYINQCIQLWESESVYTCTLHITITFTLHNKYSFQYNHSVHFHLVKIYNKNKTSLKHKSNYNAQGEFWLIQNSHFIFLGCLVFGCSL